MILNFIEIIKIDIYGGGMQMAEVLSCINFSCETQGHHVFSGCVFSSLDLNHFERRKLIRNTWGQDPISEKQKWKTYFLVGRRDDNKLLHKLSLEMKESG